MILNSFLMNSLQIEQYLNSFINYELSLGSVHPSVFKLDRIQAFLQLLGNPQDNLKFIHVAGSKGKGSVCALTASILKQAGYKVGLYTSPHLYSFKERIRVLDKESTPYIREGEIFPDSISDRELSAVLKEIRPQLEKMRSTKKFGQLTFFEVLTVLAILYFFKKKVDWVVLETGLGGRLDATNAVSSSVCAITPISLEHTQILGNTVRKIAIEKAAIIKDARSRVVIAPQEKEAIQVIKKRCQEFGIQPLGVGRDIQYEIKLQNMPLLGDHQKVNAAVAMGIVESLRDLGVKISDKAISRGLKNVYWPGRLEIIQRNPLIVLDGAHNGASAKVLAGSLTKIFPRKRAILILGVSSDKNKKDILKELKKISSCIIFTKAEHPRASNWERREVQKYLPQRNFFLTSGVEEALRLAFAKSQKKDMILVAGSLFLVAEVRKLIKEERNGSNK